MISDASFQFQGFPTQHTRFFGSRQMARSVGVSFLCALAFLGGDEALGREVDSAAEIIPVVMPGERRETVAAQPYGKRIRLCQGRVRTPKLDVTATITGPVRRQESNAQIAGIAIAEAIEAWYAGLPGASSRLRDTLREGAQIQAFTRLAPYSPPEYSGYNPMNEPVYQVANFLVPLSHAYLVVEEEYPEDTELLEAARRWGDRLYEITRNGDDTFGGRAKGVDRRVLIAQGWAHWGNVTGNREALKDAYSYYVHAMETIGRNGEDRVWVNVFPERRAYYANMTYGAAMSTAFALSRSGADDVYTIAPGGGSLVEGMAWLWGTLQKERPPELFRSRSHGSRSVAWTELFVHDFPRHAAGRKMDAWLEENSTPRFGYTSGGGPTTCMYRRVTPLEPVDDVLGMQLALMRHCSGLPAGFADGRFGPGTRAVLKRFQESHGLTPDGVYGPKTAAVLAGPVTGACD